MGIEANGNNKESPVRGRRQLPDKFRRSEKIIIKVTLEERERFFTAATDSGHTLSSWVRQVVRRRIEEDEIRALERSSLERLAAASAMPESVLP